MLKVFGAGLGRTGTHSLAAALERLGLGPCYHMHTFSRSPEHRSFWQAALDGEQVDWRDFFGPYPSSVEWPAAAFWRQILAAFPDVKVILTLRDPEAWYQSASATIFEGLELSQFNPNAERGQQSTLARELILEGVFSSRHRDKAHATAVFNRHNLEVTGAVPADRLLLYQVSEGWEPLCKFLGKPVPTEPFPHTNTRADFLSTEPEWAREIKKKRGG